MMLRWLLSLVILVGPAVLILANSGIERHGKFGLTYRRRDRGMVRP